MTDSTPTSEHVDTLVASVLFETDGSAGALRELAELAKRAESLEEQLQTAERKLAMCVDVQRKNQETYWNQTEYERKRNDGLQEQLQTARDALVKIAEGPSDVSPPEIARCALGWPAHGWEQGVYEQFGSLQDAANMVDNCGEGHEGGPCDWCLKQLHGVLSGKRCNHWPGQTECMWCRPETSSPASKSDDCPPEGDRHA